jgi:hypothetical protein
MIPDMDPVADARALIAERFPDARAAFLGGGVLSPRRTATSDLDVVVILAGPPAPYRESVRFRGWPVELFVHDEQSIAFYLAEDVARRAPCMPRMCAEGVILVDGGGLAGQIRARAAALLLAGPPALPTAELDGCRYGLSDLLDDLAGSADPGETLVIGWTVFTQTARLALLQAGHWLGGGKWLLRELRDLDPGLAARLLAAVGHPERLTEIADEVLAGTGGRLWEGYRQAGERGEPGEPGEPGDHKDPPAGRAEVPD